MSKDKRSSFWANRSGNNYSWENPIGWDPELQTNWLGSYVQPITSQIFNTDNYDTILQQIKRNMPATYGSSNSDELFIRTAMEATLLPYMQAQMGYLQNLLPYMGTYTSTQEQMTPNDMWEWQQSHPSQSHPSQSNTGSNLGTAIYGNPTPYNAMPSWNLSSIENSSYNTPANDLINMHSQLDTYYNNLGQSSSGNAYSNFGTSASNAGDALANFGKSKNRVLNQSVYNTSNNAGNQNVRNLTGSNLNSGTRQIKKPTNRRNQYV